MAETDAPTRTPESGTGWNTRMAGLPRWAWAGMAAAGTVVVWVWWRARKAATDKPADNTPPVNYTGATAEGLATEQYESLLAILRTLQGPQSTPTPTPTPTPDPTPTPTTDDLGKVTGVSATSIWTFAIEVHWKPVSGADSYKVTVSPNPELGSDKTTGPITGKMLIGEQSMQGKTFTITVAARKGDKVGPASDPVSVRVPKASEGGHTS